jgi:GLPGLI family protein
MKKAAYLLFIFFISNVFYAQSGQVDYVIKLDSLSFQDNGKFKERLKSMKEYANNQKFKLSFNKSQSSFKYIESLYSDPDFSERENRTARFAMTTSSDFYYDRVENREIQQKSDGQLIEKKNPKVSWVIGTESKKIDAYLCYKATYLESYIGRKSGETGYREVVAWFAPSLPYAFGPINFYGLPGLVLELKYKNTTYLATNIVLGGSDVFIDFPKGKTITKEDYDKKLKAQMGM